MTCNDKENGQHFVLNTFNGKIGCNFDVPYLDFDVQASMLIRDQI